MPATKLKAFLDSNDVEYRVVPTCDRLHGAGGCGYRAHIG